MKSFTEWMKDLTEGMPVGWKPNPQLSANPLRSGLEKIVRGSQKGIMPFDGNHVDAGVLQTQLGLNNDEISALTQSNLIIRGPNGVNVNKDLFNDIYKQFAKVNPQTDAPQMQPPPPVPPNMNNPS